MTTYRVTVIEKFVIHFTKDGVIRLIDPETKEEFTRYQREKLLEATPEFRAPFDRYNERLKAAKADRKQRWLSGEPWFPLDIETMAKALDAELTSAGATTAG